MRIAPLTTDTWPALVELFSASWRSLGRPLTPEELERVIERWGSVAMRSSGY